MTKVFFVSIMLLQFMGMTLMAQESCMLDSVFINALLVDPTGLNNDFDTNKDGVSDSNDEFIEICNSGSEDINLSGWQLGDDDPPPFPDFTFPDSTVLKSGSCILLVANYCPIDTAVCDIPDGIIDMDINFTGLLGNSGDVITLVDTLGNSCSVVYGGITCEDVDVLDIPGFDVSNCDNWGADIDGCPLLSVGDSCEYIPMALPVEFLNFSAYATDRQMVMLDWIVVVGENNDKYYVEWKPAFESKYQILTTKLSEGNTHEIKSFRYVHETPHSGQNFYRIRQLDFNGHATFSGVRVVNVELGDEVDLRPTVVTDDIFVNGNADTYLLSLFDISGKLIFEKIEIKNNESVDLTSLQKGYYIMRVFNGLRTKNFKFIKI